MGRSLWLGLDSNSFQWCGKNPPRPHKVMFGIVLGKIKFLIRITVKTCDCLFTVSRVKFPINLLWSEIIRSHIWVSLRTQSFRGVHTFLQSCYTFMFMFVNLMGLGGIMKFAGKTITTLLLHSTAKPSGKFLVINNSLVRNSNFVITHLM